MNKQELKEKRERIQIYIRVLIAIETSAQPTNGDRLTSNILTYLGNEGVKIVDEKVELPIDEFLEGETIVWLNDAGEASKRSYQKAKQDMLKAGFRKVYLLVED